MDDLKRKFETAVANQTAQYEKNGCFATLDALRDCVEKLRAAGMHIGLELDGLEKVPPFKEISGETGRRMVLTIEEREFGVTFVNGDDGRPLLVMGDYALSPDFDANLKYNACSLFDLQKPDSRDAFYNRVISQAATSHVFRKRLPEPDARNDAARVIRKRGKLKIGE